MKTFISILRGINVGGHKKINMADLKNMYEELGFVNVKTYIQSGNVIFQSEPKEVSNLELQLEEAIMEKFGFEVPVIVREKHEWEELLEKNPFLAENTSIDHLFVSFLSQPPRLELRQKLKSRETENDQIKVIEKNAYLKISGPYHKTPLSNQRLEKTLKVKATTRNWKGVLKIWKML